MYCLCVNVYCHWVTIQLQLINISYFGEIMVFCYSDFVGNRIEIRNETVLISVQRAARNDMKV